ncbi:MAG: hypothetical protein ABEJ30_02430 [Halorientalis sp.]
MSERVSAENWRRALALARQLDRGTVVSVAKSAEPTLPEDIDLLRSNFPWSIHKGATAVYREDSPGEHIQIREYPDRWTVARDSSNPHYRPINHARHDVTTAAVATLPVFATVQTVRLSGQLATEVVRQEGRLLNHTLLPILSRTLL